MKSRNLLKLILPLLHFQQVKRTERLIRKTGEKLPFLSSLLSVVRVHGAGFSVGEAQVELEKERKTEGVGTK